MEVGSEDGKRHQQALTNLILTLDKQVQQLLCIDHCLPIVGHEADEGRVPLVHNLGEGGGTGCHQYLPHTVMKLLQ